MLLSSLTKVFPDETPKGAPLATATLLQNERFSFQCVYHVPCDKEVTVAVNTALPARLFRVGCVQVPHPDRPDMPMDEDVLRLTPGRYPDVLYPVTEQTVPAEAGWNSLWVMVEGDLPVGEWPVTVTVDGHTDTCTLTVLGAALPPPALTYTAWFHTDCVADYYHVPVFSEAHWTLLESYFRNAAEFGQTMLYVPLYTPPLDTPVDGERRTVQLLDITVKDGQYTFDFDRVARWMQLALDCGFTAFEMPHLFTQWGAAACPKIFAHTDEGERRIFGWDVASDSDAYRAFLAQMLPALRAFLVEKGWLSRCVFHFSDEPNEDNLSSYRRARDGAAPLLAGCQTMDALSHYTFYEQGLVDLPVVATNAVAPFLQHHVKPLWVYYCCGQRDRVCNRFICQPSYRNRGLGFQLFMQDAAGFLQWGYNYWYTCLSGCLVDPFTGAPEDVPAFPAGDAYVVYPGADGPLPSLRQVVFGEALQDLRACQALAGLTSREEVEALIRESGCEFAFDAYLRSDEALLALRETINLRIAAVVSA